jgi:hypothetical protein
MLFRSVRVDHFHSLNSAEAVRTSRHYTNLVATAPDDARRSLHFGAD